MRLTLSNCFRVLLAAAFVFSMCAPTPAQEVQIDALADQMAVSLSNAKLTTVAVFDFVGPDETDALGQKLAADFRAALAKSAHGFQVEDRSKLLDFLRKQKLAPEGISDAVTASWVLEPTETEAFILGTLSNKSDGLQVSLEAFRVERSQRISKFETSLPLTDDLKAFIGENEKGKDLLASLPRAATKGYSSPSCIYCPQPRYSAEASRAKFEGNVMLEITVDEGGHVRDIKVIRGLPLGLTGQAIEAVREWRLKPATGPDGKPAAVRTTIEMTFRLY
jgi:TonB family protein